MKICLNLGAGVNQKRSTNNVRWVNVDFMKEEGIDIVHNLEEFPYPFKDNSIDYILMDNVLEHLKDTIKVMEELHRICKPNAIIEIFVPHYSSACAFSSLTHKRYFGSQSFNDLARIDSNFKRYTPIEFKILQNKLRWFSCRDWWFVRPFKLLIDRVINLNPFWAERFLCYYLSGFDSIHFKLQVIKTRKEVEK